MYWKDISLYLAQNSLQFTPYSIILFLRKFRRNDTFLRPEKTLTVHIEAGEYRVYEQIYCTCFCSNVLYIAKSIYQFYSWLNCLVEEERRTIILIIIIA